MIQSAVNLSILSAMSMIKNKKPPMINEQIVTIIKIIMPYEEIEIDENMDLIDDLAFDSIKMMNLIVELEKSFEISFEDNLLDTVHFSTPKNIIQTVEKHLGKKSTTKVLNNYEEGEL